MVSELLAKDFSHKNWEINQMMRISSLAGS